MRDSITFSPQNAQGIDLRIFAGSGSRTDVGSIETMLSLEAGIIQLVRALLFSYNSSGISFPWKCTRTPDLDDRQYIVKTFLPIIFDLPFLALNQCVPSHRIEHQHQNIPLG